MIKAIFVFLFVLQMTAVHSQNNANSPFAFSIGYFGDNGIHPGIKLGGYYDFTSFEKSKKRKLKRVQDKKGNRKKYKSYYGFASLGVYSHANNHNGWFSNFGSGYESVNSRQGNLFGYSLSLGYLFRDYKFKTYEVVNGELSVIGAAGSGGVVFSLAPHIGRDLRIKTKIPLRVQLKPVIQLIQYNHGFVPNAALELEFIYNL